ncbi:MAG: type II toxin-antitoxin system VapC family toxin [Bacteroidia bacterium]|nr:type II toxin-antitoxin system VapC family toxin [Bacteroidia bacterium]
MRRYYLDTNILIFIFFDKDGLSSAISSLLDNYDCCFYTSSICVLELVHLMQINKLKSKEIKDAIDIFEYLQEANIQISPVTEKHLKEYANLPYYKDHNDPNDRIIIAQSISDKIALISSDTKFDRYIENGLKFEFNKR